MAHQVIKGSSSLSAIYQACAVSFKGVPEVRVIGNKPRSWSPSCQVATIEAILLTSMPSKMPIKP